MRKFLRFLVWTIIIVSMVVGFLRLTVIRWWRVPKGDPYLEASILPTLRGGDLLILWRASRPAFGDLVICPEPKASERIVIGRIAGEAGDRVKLKDSDVWVNGQRADTERACRPPEFTAQDPQTKREVSQSCQEETLGRNHLRGAIDPESAKPEDHESEVPAQHVFLLSDNRRFPYDSREFGPVEQDTCKETIVFRLVSHKGFFDVENRFMFIH